MRWVEGQRFDIFPRGERGVRFFPSSRICMAGGVENPVSRPSEGL